MSVTMTTCLSVSAFHDAAHGLRFGLTLVYVLILDSSFWKPRRGKVGRLVFRMLSHPFRISLGLVMDT